MDAHFLDPRQPRIALLIDSENAPASKLDLVLNEIASHGVAHVRRAYGDWKSAQLRPWEDQLHLSAIQPMQQFAYSSGKNASDMALVIDALDLLYGGSIDAFGIFSSDADFTPLVMRLLAGGKNVYGFGERKTPLPFVNACSVFTYVDALERDLDDDMRRVERGGKISGDDHLDAATLRMLRNAVKTAAGEDGWAHLSTVGQLIRNQASFDARNYGFGKLSELVRATGLYDEVQDGLAVRIRPRR